MKQQPPVFKSFPATDQADIIEFNKKAQESARIGRVGTLHGEPDLLRRAFAHSLNTFPAPGEFTADADEAFSGRGRWS